MPTLQWVRLFVVVSTSVNAFLAFFMWQQATYDAYFQAWLIANNLNAYFGFGFVVVCMIVAVGIATATTPFKQAPKLSKSEVTDIVAKEIERQRQLEKPSAPSTPQETGDTVLVIPKQSAFATFIQGQTAKYSAIDERETANLPRLPTKPKKDQHGTD